MKDVCTMRGRRARGAPTWWPRALLIAALLGLGCAAAFLAGCGRSVPPLEGTSWRLTAWSVSAQDPGDLTITAAFADGRISGSSAVNQYGGPYSAGQDGSFSVGELASTMMAGPEPQMRAESTYIALLGAAAGYEVTADSLTLFDAGGNESLVFAPIAER